MTKMNEYKIRFKKKNTKLLTNIKTETEDDYTKYCR